MRQFQRWFDKVAQILLPVFTVSGFFLTANKMPKYGFTLSALSQIFWLYTSYQAYKKAGQIGIFVTTIVMTFITFYGLYNWWSTP